MSAVADFANECRDYLIAVAESVEDTIANLDAIIPLEEEQILRLQYVRSCLLIEWGMVETLEGASDDRT